MPPPNLLLIKKNRRVGDPGGEVVLHTAGVEAGIRNNKTAQQTTGLASPVTARNEQISCLRMPEIRPIS
jgi:hypothetical protein